MDVWLVVVVDVWSVAVVVVDVLSVVEVVDVWSEVVEDESLVVVVDVSLELVEGMESLVSDRNIHHFLHYSMIQPISMKCLHSSRRTVPQILGCSAEKMKVKKIVKY